ncbi:DNA-directed RNA polymerase subunit beta' [Rickettsiales bacterium LUAb2]
MEDVNAFFKDKGNNYLENNNVTDFDKIVISIASPDKIKSWSWGEVTKPETINYRTFKPEKDGLFCAKIFGPIKDYECLCGKYKRMKYKGIVCEKCGVEVIQQKVRRERMGHIELAAPVAHIWFYKPVPSKIGLMLDISAKQLESVLYFESYIVIDPGISNFKAHQILSEEEYEEAVSTMEEGSFVAGMGAEAIKDILQNMDLDYEAAKLKDISQSSGSEVKIKKALKKLKIIEGFLKSGIRPDWMILDILPVLPPELRPLVPLDGGRFASSDLNDLYRRVINRNNRLKRLLELRAPTIIIRNEKRMLQESVDALFDNSRRVNPISDSNKRPLKSFSDILKGKQGRFRQNLLGKRVDYSGRSVITVGPYLKLHECGLPKKMALELFKPFIYSKLQLYGIASTIKMAKKIVEKERAEVWDILEEVIKEHPVLLNRAPTLHRLGIQAFEPKLIEGKAIHLHPLVCAAFNADFDGDQMAVHIPLSLEAKLEARVLMLSTNNVLSPANGKPVIVPSQDIVLGLYYLSIERDGELGEGKAFASIHEIEHALDNKALSLHAKIKFRHTVTEDNGETVSSILDTTPGRVVLFDKLPKGYNLKFDLINKVLTSKEIAKLIETVFKNSGQRAVVEFVDQVMELGFHTACKAGISIGKDDLIVPSSKNKLVAETEQKVHEYEQQYQDGLITKNEKYNKAIEAWSLCTDKVADAMMKEMFKVEVGKPLNSVYMMAHSGARSSPAQMKQLAGMRGLMAKPSGEIIENPIISNFKEGLDALEYFNSTHGARKGLADTALKTANAGYLTRRLVDVAQDCIVISEDCNTNDGIYLKPLVESGKVVSSVGERAIGRFLAEDVKDFNSGKVIVAANSYIDENLSKVLDKHNVAKIKIRSVLTCKEEIGVCVKCYGRDISKGYVIGLGEAVGVIAAQSIGEPGTQLTMRTFHIGGAVQQAMEKNSIESPIDGIVELRKCHVVKNSDNINIVMSRSGEIVIKDDQGQEKFVEKLTYGSKIYVENQQKISFNTKLAEWDPFTNPIISDVEGEADFVGLLDGISLVEQVDEITGISFKSVIEQQGKGRKVSPRINIIDKDKNIIALAKGDASYLLPVGAIMNVENGHHIKPGDIIAKIPKESTKARDITGGLPRVIELFEARKYKDAAIVTELSGIVEYNKNHKNKISVIVRSLEDENVFAEYSVSKDKQLMVFEGDQIEKGDQITDGFINPHDILNTKGITALADYMVSEVQAVYKMQGVVIDDKHIEVIVKQMLKRIEITNSGDSEYVIGDQINRTEANRINGVLISENKKPIEYIPILQSITRASLQTDSFISAASFQETTKALTEASLVRKEDSLEGLKENIIIGRLIPVGTGFWAKAYKTKNKKVLKELD